MNRPEVLVTRGKVSPAEGGKGGRSVFARTLIIEGRREHASPGEPLQRLLAHS